ncbi:predicted protein [Uncinocarpus reesii 1704]|uniref:Uncharacterized protein n=1 Tax=Uncinocarpus reesii (strain UAMH 1704) TaxID=336963 RepID=C4JHC8_UNCRE|nr:uncharacterized protein UREG_02701 [Uncinocarpus reesii 1704]EEP77852.1 predicted protein [Uncinocarpus reesii 1704]
MPTLLHDCHQEWIKDEMYDMTRAGFLSDAELKFLRTRVGTTFKTFGGIWENSRKDPDLCLLGYGQFLPTVVMESGYSESRPQLQADMRLWLKGGAPAVQLVLIINWSELVGKKIKGSIEAWELNGDTPTLIQEEVIFPQPPGNPAQAIGVTRGQLFGNATFPNRNRNDTYNLSIENLRNVASWSIRDMGFIPV